MPDVETAVGRLAVYRDFDGDPVNDLALEGDLLERAGSGQASLFLYSWVGPVVVLGYGQKAADIDVDWCRGRGVPVLRRVTGGTGVVHTQDLAVSLFLPERHPWATGIVGLYGRFLEVLEPALNRAGGTVARMKEPARAARVRSPICFEDQLADTLAVDGRKVVGCAQARRRGGVLIHALVSLNLDAATYAGVFAVCEDRVLRGLGVAVPGGRPEAVADALGAAFIEALEMSPRFETAPRASAPRLAAYATPRWRATE